MVQDHFQLVSVADGKTDADAIIKVFADMHAGRLKSDLTLLNFCNEIPVSYGTTILAVDKDSVELSVHEHQAQILKQNNSTLIKSKAFAKDLAVHCYAAYVNVSKKVAILHNFAYAQIRADRREAVRVRVHGTLPARFFCENLQIEGTVIDISASGISLWVEGPLPAIAEGAGVMAFNLLDSPLTMPATFVRAKPTSDSRQIAIFTIAPDRLTDTVIGKYIYQRQVEVIVALKEGLVVE